MRTPARRTPMFLALGLGVGLVATLVVAGLGPHSSADAASGAAMNREAFRAQMRTLWAGDHIVWTRCLIVSAATLPELLPDLEETATRLHANQDAIGAAFKPFYGNEAGNELAALLHVHIDTAAELILAAKAHDNDAAADASARWYANAEEIAAFLHELNPSHWPLATVEDLLEAHLDLTLQEAGARLAANYSGDIAAYDNVHGQILQLADALSAGIIAQFPQKFAR
jgi:hypothetical protein